MSSLKCSKPRKYIFYTIPAITAPEVIKNTEMINLKLTLFYCLPRII